MTRTGPNTQRKQAYRVGVLCHSWKCQHQPRVFVFDDGHWVCTVCRFVETDTDGSLAPDPWGER